MFAYREIHAPFAINLAVDDLDAGVEALAPVLELAADLDVSIVTVHAEIRDDAATSTRNAWLSAMAGLDQQAAAARTTIGLEINDGFDAVMAWDLPHVGVTLDIGHMYAPAQNHVLSRHGGLGGLIRHLGPALVHMHLHDTDGVTDHFEIGTGIVDFGGMVDALAAIDYEHAATLEMNPDRCSPEGIVRGAACLREMLTEAGLL